MRSTDGTHLWNSSAAGTVTWGPWSPPMQSMATVMSMPGLRRPLESAGRLVTGLLALAFGYFLAPVEAGRADVVAQVHLPGRRLDGQRRAGEEVVGAVHAALGRGFLVLLDCHGETPLVNSRRGRPD